jgi:hypothetical protein
VTIGAVSATDGAHLNILVQGGLAVGIPPGETSQTFSYNGTSGLDGSAQTFTVPLGVTEINIDCFGSWANDPYTNGGGGGRALAIDVPVTPGEELNVYVGCYNPLASGGGGYPDGGGQLGGSGAPGGGSSRVTRSPHTHADVLCQAGGGGGDAGGQMGGGGGYPAGGDGAGSGKGTGGSQSAGGTVGGGAWQGGNAGVDVAGGGGGYYGGGAGVNFFGGGGGGSNYVTTTASAALHESGTWRSGGTVVISWEPPA